MLDNNNNLIEIVFMDGTDELITADELINAYLNEYNKILRDYAEFYREGTVIKQINIMSP